VTPDELVLAGLYDPDAPDAEERLELLLYLVEHGFDLEVLKAADDAGELLDIAGDTMFRRPRTLTCHDMGARVGLPPEVVARVWRSYGFPVPSLDELLFGEAEVSVFSGFAITSAHFGVESMLQWARVMGSGLTRVADTSISLFLSKVASQLEAEHAPPIVSARASSYAIRMLMGVPELIMAPLFPHYVEAARRRGDQRGDTGSFDLKRLAVGLVDLVDFTPLAAMLPPNELAVALDDLETAASDIVTSTKSGLIVKYLGDALLFVASDPDEACSIALELCDRVDTHAVLTALRGGVAYGDLLSVAGDYFGPPVNLAARAAALAPPGGVLVTAEVVDVAPRATADAVCLGPQPIKGFSEPIELYRLVHN